MKAFFNHKLCRSRARSRKCISVITARKTERKTRKKERNESESETEGEATWSPQGEAWGQTQPNHVTS